MPVFPRLRRLRRAPTERAPHVSDAPHREVEYAVAPKDEVLQGEEDAGEEGDDEDGAGPLCPRDGEEEEREARRGDEQAHGGDAAVQAEEEIGPVHVLRDGLQYVVWAFCERGSEGA